MNRSRLVRLSLIALISFSSLPAASEKAPDGNGVAIDEILLLGPIATPTRSSWPGDAAEQKEINHLAQRIHSRGLPDHGDSWTVFGKSLSWRKADLRSGIFDLADDAKGLWVASLVIEAQRWTSGRIEAKAPGAAVAFLEGRRLGQAGDDGALSHKVELIPGTHHLLLLFNRPDAEGPSELRMTLQVDSSASAQSTATSVRSQRRVSMQQLNGAPNVQSLRISPDGEEVALALRRRDFAGDRWASSLQIRRFSDGALLRSWQASSPGNLDWSPDGKWISYVSRQGGKSSLWLQDRRSGSRRALMEAVEGLGTCRWAPDSRSVLCEWARKSSRRKDGIKRYRGLRDRWTGWRDRHQIFQIDVESGFSQQLTQGEWSANLLDISADSKRVLFEVSVPEWGKPPYHSKTLLQEHSLESGEVRTLQTFRSFLGSAFYWGDSLIVSAGATAFDRLGGNVASGQVPNDYDTQLFLLDPANGRVRPLSKDFDPAVDSFEADPSRGIALVQATDRTRVKLFELEIESGRYSPLPSQMMAVGGFDYAPPSKRLVWEGTSLLEPQKVFAMDLKSDSSPRLLFDPTGPAYSQTRFGEVQTWSFQSASGGEIAGRFYTPPSFDPAAKYPLIVYYYGGTVPVTDQFSSRYPWNLWASKGYVVYVLQPSGATGFGQEFSARHVNQWGGRTADEIIEGTRKFLQAHSFVDPGRVGCIGASYGGFMTMYLTTRTDIFSAAVSHAGISSLSSYWGQGNWGFLYSGVASYGSYPWNNPELYVEHSPLFQADKVSTPLLLLHGDSDTNVPVGESQQMYTALKVLGKEVELITVEGEDHHILDYRKRLLWWSTILAWFEKHLKGQEEWWQDLYPES